MIKVKKNDTVQVHYKLSLDGKAIVESTFDAEPLKFTMNAGHVVPGLERAVRGMTIGQSKTVVVPPEEGYGDYDDDLVVHVPKSNLPSGIELKPGMVLEAAHQPVTIKEVTDSGAVVDLNTPLAGEFLTFELTLIDIIR